MSRRRRLMRVGAFGDLSPTAQLRAQISEGSVIFTPMPALDGNEALFQTVAGIELADAGGDPAGLMLDAYPGFVLGPEELENRDFSAGADGWVFGSSWTAEAGGAVTDGTASGAVPGKVWPKNIPNNRIVGAYTIPVFHYICK